MSLETAFTGAAFPIPPDALLAASVGDLLVFGSTAMQDLIPEDHPDLEPHRTVVDTWRALSGEIDALPTFTLCGTDVPGDVWLPVLHTESGECESDPDARKSC